MIDSTHRFHGRSSLQFAYKRGRVVRNQLCSLRYVVNNRRQSYRVAVVVSRKVNKSAVVRNRLRRRIYEIIRLRSNDIILPYDLVISVFSDQLSDMDGNKLTEMIEGLFESANILNNKSLSESKLHDIVNAKERNG